jgi:hypothetical protein
MPDETLHHANVAMNRPTPSHRPSSGDDVRRLADVVRGSEGGRNSASAEITRPDKSRRPN